MCYRQLVLSKADPMYDGLSAFVCVMDMHA